MFNKGRHAFYKVKKYCLTVIKILFTVQFITNSSFILSSLDLFILMFHISNYLRFSLI